MRIQFLGTGASEGVPCPYCVCEACERARQMGRNYIRSRCGAIIDGQVKLDFPPDTYSHIQRYGLDFTRLKHILITHTHWDHFAMEDILYRRYSFSYPRADVPVATVYGNAEVGRMLGTLPKELAYREMKPFESVEFDGYRVSALKAVHKPDETALFYLIERDGKGILYAHDTDEFPEEDFDFLAGRGANLVSLDATKGVIEANYVGHMSIDACLRVRDRLLRTGAAKPDAVFVLNHFSHNGIADPDVMAKRADGCLIAYDGMIVEV